MAKAAVVKKKVEASKTTVLSDVRLYARKIWLAGLPTPRPGRRAPTTCVTW